MFHPLVPGLDPACVPEVVVAAVAGVAEAVPAEVLEQFWNPAKSGAASAISAMSRVRDGRGAGPKACVIAFHQSKDGAAPRAKKGR
jgi:hypothetical protein